MYFFLFSGSKLSTVSHGTGTGTVAVNLTDLNPHFVCVLCFGYFVNATTISECMHTCKYYIYTWWLPGFFFTRIQSTNRRHFCGIWRKKSVLPAGCGWWYQSTRVDVSNRVNVISYRSSLVQLLQRVKQVCLRMIHFWLA